MLVDHVVSKYNMYTIRGFLVVYSFVTYKNTSAIKRLVVRVLL